MSTFKVSIGKADSTRQLYMKRPGVKVIQIIGNAREIPRIRTKVKLVRIHIYYKPIKLHLTRTKKIQHVYCLMTVMNNSAALNRLREHILETIKE